jgi:hypothetical protein
MKTSSFFTHLAMAIKIVTGIFLAIYATVRQTHYSRANDRQLQQFARDIESKISNDKPYDQLLRMIQ